MPKAKPALSHEASVENLTRDLKLAKAAQEKRFTQIVRYVWRERSKPASNSGAQILRDMRLCGLLTEYGKESEIVGMIDLVRDMKSHNYLRAPITSVDSNTSSDG
jgi:hypothetical protein